MKFSNANIKGCMMNRRSEPLRISFSLSPDTVRTIFDFIAEATGTDIESRKADRRMEVSQKAIYAGEEPPVDINLMVTRRQAAELLQISTRTIDNLKRDGRMPQPNRIGKAVRWNRAELVAWVDAGCPDCNGLNGDDPPQKTKPHRVGRLTAGKKRIRRPKAEKLPTEAKSQSRNRNPKQPVPPTPIKESRFQKFVTEIGLDYEKLPTFTKGQVRESWVNDVRRNYPDAVATLWAGHTQGVSDGFYLHAFDADFERAAVDGLSGAQGGAAGR